MDKEIKQGLKGVIVDTSSISNINPELKSLIYRGYPAPELAEKCCFEEIAYLIWYGELPTKKQLEQFKEKEKSERDISKELLSVINQFPKNVHSIDGLKTCISFLGIEENGNSSINTAIKLMAKIPTIITAIQSHKTGGSFIRPSKDLGFSENFLHMYFKKVPEPEIVKAFDVIMILYAEHGFNASTFSARVTTSTESDMYSAIVSAIGTLKGPLHGGANIEVMEILQKIKSPTEAERFIMEKLAKKENIPGFGHRVYRQGDARVPILQKYVKELSRLKNRKDLIEISEIIEKIMIRDKNIFPNVDFPVGIAYYLIGIDIDIYVSLFAMARIVGWTAHILEQKGNNHLIRPLCKYIGHANRSVVALDKRV